MKILYIVPYTPNLIRVRPYNLIRALKNNGNEITVCTLYEKSSELRDVRNLEKISQSVIAASMPKWLSYWNCAMAIPTLVPLQYVYSWNSTFAKLLRSICYTREGKPLYDVIHVEHLRGAKYGVYLNANLKFNNGKIPVVWDSVDCISLLFRFASKRSSGPRKWITQFELPRTERQERKLLEQFSRICVTSKLDRAAFENLSGHSKQKAKIDIIPNGVDLDYFSVGQPQNRKLDTLVVSGKMSYHANVRMVLFLANEIMPLLWNEKPSIRLQIVGKDPVPEIQNLRAHPMIEVVGEVPDMRPYLQQATIALTPIQYGAGIQNKVLEAMSCGTPVVSTTQAVSALDIFAGRDLLVADEPKEFAMVVRNLLDDPQKRIEIGISGRKYVELNHNWQVIASKLEEIYNNARQQGTNNENI